MEILIVGAGAMGSLLGALLAPFAEVCLLTTNADHAQTIGREGITLTGLDGAVHRLSIPVLTEPRQYGRRADLVLVCTKARATGEAARTAQEVLAEDGLVLTLQNGLGNLERIAAVVGAQRAAAGTTAQAATLLAPGQVRHAGSGPTVLGAGPGQSATIASVARLFNQAGIETRVTGDVDALLWSKLIVNVGINALTALLRITNGILGQVPECEVLMSAAVAEAEAVARALGIDLPSASQAERVREICLLTGANRSSMLQDILKGRPTEIDVINGAVVAKGVETGIPTPINLLLTQLIEALEATASHRL